MKIIGFTTYNDETKMVLKSDSSLLNNRKPFFTPENGRISAYACLVIRICRLGKNIAARFADRYYDALSYGINFVDEQALAHNNHAAAYGFDYSLAIGEWVESVEGTPLIPIEEAIHRVSQVMTIRTGDLIFIDLQGEPLPTKRETIIEKTINENTILYCKIK